MSMSAEAFKLTRIPSLKTVDDFRRHVASLDIELPCEDRIASRSRVAARAAASKTSPINGKTIGNRLAIQPMEGWDGNDNGRRHG